MNDTKKNLCPILVMKFLLCLIGIELLVFAIAVATKYQDYPWEVIPIDLCLIVFLGYTITYIGELLRKEAIEDAGWLVFVSGLVALVALGCVYLATIHILWGIGAATLLIGFGYLVFEACRKDTHPSGGERQ